MHSHNRPVDALTQEAATRIARRCRHVIQVVLREDEWVDADMAFFEVAIEELVRLREKRSIEHEDPNRSNP